ncbi:MAG: glycosyl hydrolase [Planctomycetota bacterium]
MKSMRWTSLTLLVTSVAITGCASAYASGHHSEDEAEHNHWFGSLEWRNIGPSRGGRSVAIAGVVGDRHTYYMGGTGGGVWKTTDSGERWENISDGFFKTGSVGSIKVAPSNPNILYVGMGEHAPRGNFSHGDGVYKSSDAGKTWTHLGLEDTRQISSVVVHPDDPDVVYVGALGHIYGADENRGVYRTTDGGETWDLIKYVDDTTGVSSLSMDPHNSNVLYAGFWTIQRTPWSMSSGGDGSGLYKSTDGGESWEELTEGLPEGVKGKVGVSASAAKRDVVYAIVEADDGGVFRSDDAGATWTKTNEQRDLRQRAWYYSVIQADPQDVDTVYVMNVQFHKSTDGGKSFERIRVPHVDNHDIWIDPEDNQRIINANDGGANISFNGGATWSRQSNQPTAQYYRVTTDNSYPYRVYGAQQDNSTISISSTNRLGRWERDWYPVGGGESGYIAVHPEDPNLVYAGSYLGFFTRYHHDLGKTKSIHIWPENSIGAGPAELRHRFQWTFPIVISPHDPETIYAGGERVFRSTNRGDSWTAISPDLTTNDKSKQQSSGGPITQDNTSVEYYCTVFGIDESVLLPGLIWVGTDDGKIHVTGNAGASWTDVTPPALEVDSLVNTIHASRHDADTCYAAVTRFKHNDFTPLIYRTTDRGVSWDIVTEGIPDGDFVRVVRDDPGREGLLYAGTETGVYVSFDNGDTWESLQLELPRVPITDMEVKDNDLVIATQGRSFWILDGLEVLRQMDLNSATESIALMAPHRAYRENWSPATVHFNLPSTIEGEAKLAYLDDEGEVMREFAIDLKIEDPEPEEGEEPEGGSEAEAEASDDSGGEAEERATARRGRGARRGGGGAGMGGPPSAPGPGRDARIEAEPGMNKHSWNFRREAPAVVPGAVGWPNLSPGVRVIPGDYTVRLTIGETVIEQPLLIEGDPRLDISDADWSAQDILLDRIYRTLDQTHETVNLIRDIRGQISGTTARVQKAGGDDSVMEAAKALNEKIDEIENALIQTKSKSAQDPLNFPVMINDKLKALMFGADTDGRPSQAYFDVMDDLEQRLAPHFAAINRIKAQDIPAFNEAVAAASVPAVILESEDPEGAEEAPTSIGGAR